MGILMEHVSKRLLEKQAIFEKRQMSRALAESTWAFLHNGSHGCLGVPEILALVSQDRWIPLSRRAHRFWSAET